MLFLLGMGNAANDDDDSLPFIRIAAATANVMAFLEAKRPKKEANDNTPQSESAPLEKIKQETVKHRAPRS